MATNLPAMSFRLFNHDSSPRALPFGSEAEAMDERSNLQQPARNNAPIPAGVGVRRNLFSTSSRRPVGQASNSGTGTHHRRPRPQEERREAKPRGYDFIERDRFGDPIFPFNPDVPKFDKSEFQQDEDEQDTIDPTAMLASLAPGLKLSDIEKEDMLELLKASMKEKAESLDEDNWMFEGDELEAGVGASKGGA